ncbi:TrmH family RNA methyltransferase [Alkalihalobacillus pseudalcaliphilus]|uniref:TrmH family RNA methyltransferase n=1 Tax=Alkalihalobacillus pseudalcaliphilus TaxID=79884 RepID=UPI00064DB310|nr:RNA methyltransferase [Alkalihalobacillus pseudalcaliphilus]KMK74589.1 RNA methyltransferase [Alkalihalobacillus pseudalcaliphilus]
MKRIESAKNPQIKQWKKLQTKKGREQTGLFIIEGAHLVEEAAKAQMKFEALLITDESQLDKRWNMDKRHVYIVNGTVIKELSETDSPQGLVAIVQMRALSQNIAARGQWLLIDRVQDPGNIGTMIRTAEACGLTGVILGQGSVDLYNGKVIRATQGAAFHIPVIKADLLQVIDEFQANNIPVFGTAFEDATSFRDIEEQAQFALVVGNEGQGVAKDILSKCKQNLYIPIIGQAESLNVAVASGILMYALKPTRQ